MITSDYKKRVRYGETDMMGYLYYGLYAQYYEIGRVELMRNIGLIYNDLEQIHRVMMPVAHVESRYIRPAKYDDQITIRTILKTFPTRMIVFDYEFYNESEELLHTGVVKLFFVDMVTGKTVSCPDYMKDGLKVYFDGQ